MCNNKTDSFMIGLCNQGQEHIKCLEHIISCIIGYFDNEDSENESLRNVPTAVKGDNTLKLQGKSIVKNKKCDTWYTRYRENGVQYYISGKSQKEVYEKLKQQLGLTTTARPNRNITLGKWYKKWVETFKVNVVKKTTIVSYESSMKHIDKSLLNMPIRQISAFDIIANLNKVKEERSKQKVYELLNALFEKAYNLQMIPFNIVRQIDKPKHIREEGIALSQSEQKVFIENCKKDSKYGDLFLVTLYQGLRIGEVLGITGNDIDLVNNTLKIDKAFTNGEMDTTKNQQSNRVMPLFKGTRAILEKYVSRKDRRVFVKSRTSIGEALKGMCRKCEIREIFMHDLRHTFITNCKLKNIPEYVIQTWVGHKIGSKVTSSVYTHTNIEDIAHYVAKFDE